MPRGGPDGGDGGHGGDVVLVCDPSRRDLGALTRAASTSAPGAGSHGEGLQPARRPRRGREIPVPPGTQAETRRRQLDRPGRARTARGGRPRRARRPRQQALRQLDPAGAALRREGDRRRGGLDRAAAEAARRRRPDRPAQRRQVLAARPPHPGRAEGRRLSLHDVSTGARDARGRRPPGRPRRHPRPDRRRRRGRRPRPRVPRPRRALRDARSTSSTSPRSRATRPANYDAVRAELSSYGAGLDRLPELVVLSKRDLLPPDDVGMAIKEWRERPRRPAPLDVLAVSSATGEGLDELRQAILAAAAGRRCRRGAGRRRRRAGRVRGRAPRLPPGRRGRLLRSSARTTAASGSSAAASSCSSSATTSTTKRRSPTSRAASTRSACVAALRAAGFEPGDDVRIGEHEFELHPG